MSDECVIKHNGSATMLIDFVIPAPGQRVMEAWKTWNEWRLCGTPRTLCSPLDPSQLSAHAFNASAELSSLPHSSRIVLTTGVRRSASLQFTMARRFRRASRSVTP